MKRFPLVILTIAGTLLGLARPGAPRAAPATDPLDAAVGAWQKADDRWWRVLTRHGADSLAVAGQRRRAEADRVLSALEVWSRSEAGASATRRAGLVEAALLARRQGSPDLARRALVRLAGLLPETAVDAGLVRLSAGAALAEAGDTAGARRWLREASRVTDFAARDFALARLGDLEACARDTAAAASAWETLTRLDPPALRADRGRVFLAAAALKSGRPEAAVELAQAALGGGIKGEDAAQANLAIARAQFRLDRAQAGREACLRVMGEAPGSLAARAAWRLLAGRAAAAGLALTVDERLAAGTVLLRGGQEAEGTALLDAVALDSVPPERRVDARARRAEWLFARRRWDDARDAYIAMEKAAAPGSLRRAEARLGQARCLRNAHQPDAMARMFRSIAADTAQGTVAATALWEWAREYKALGRFAGADSALTLYIDRYPYGNDILGVLLTRGVGRMMQNRPAAAEEDFRTLQRRADRRADKEQGAFWAARAALAQGRRAEALDILKGAVTWTLPDGYYGYRIRGFLKELEPSTELVPPYAPLTAERPGDPLRPAGLAELHPRCRAHFQRGLDLARAGFEAEAQAELARAAELAPDDPTMLEATAAVAAREELYTAAMSAARRALGRAGSSGEETRLWRHVYALGHFDLIGPAAATHRLDPMLVSGVIRQESLFEARAVSRAGARGLMQLMLPTARQMARASGNVEPGSDDLFRPEISVRYGTQYLRDKIAEFDGRVEVALAAYNAGEAKAREWAALLPAWDPDLYVELIGYAETRDYVRRVRYNQATYRALYAPTRGAELE